MTASHSDNDTLNKKTDFCLHRLNIQYLTEGSTALTFL